MQYIISKAGLHNHAVAWSSVKEYGSQQVHHFPAVLPLRLSVPRTSYNQGSCRDTQKSQALFLDIPQVPRSMSEQYFGARSILSATSSCENPNWTLFFRMRSPTAKRSYASLFRFIKTPLSHLFLIVCDSLYHILAKKT